jgi:hypothetical protein
LVTTPEPAKRKNKQRKNKHEQARPATAQELLRAAAQLLPAGAATAGGVTGSGVLAQFDTRVPDYLLDCLVELGNAAPAPPGYWLLLRRAAWLLPDVTAGGYHRRHPLPRPNGVRREPRPGGSAQSLLLARRRSEGS